MKAVLQISFGFLVMFFLCFVYVIQKVLSNFIQSKIFNNIRIKLVQAFILTVLLSYQKLVMGAFTLVQCVDIRGLTVLYIQANVECYTQWQIGILIYICISVIPIFFVLAHVPFYVKDKVMTVKIFILTCLFPLPLMIGYHVTKKWNRSRVRGFAYKSKIKTLEMVEITVEDKIEKTIEEGIPERESLSDDGLTASSEHIEEQQKVECPLEGNDVEIESYRESSDSSAEINDDHKSEIFQLSGDYDEKKPTFARSTVGDGVDRASDDADLSYVMKQDNKEPMFGNVFVHIKERGSCEGEIVESLLKHYKCLTLFGIRFTWLGVHKIYRVILVACRTFITEPVTRLYAMTVLVLVMTAANVFIKPYKEQRANKTATLSYIANFCIAVINLVKAHLVNFGCESNCGLRDTVLFYIEIFEDVLLRYVPIIALGGWVVYTGLMKCMKKLK